MFPSSISTHDNRDLLLYFIVYRSMSNDLELPNSPKTVIRTYSNAARGGTAQGTAPCMSPGGSLATSNNNNNLLVKAISNNINSKEGIELDVFDNSAVRIEIHNDERASR